MVNVNYLSRPVLLDSHRFKFKINYSRKLCIDRLVDDIGIKLGTHAKISKCKVTSFGDLISVNNSLLKHELYLDDIVKTIAKHKLTYNFILYQCNEVGRDLSAVFRSPWNY